MCMIEISLIPLLVGMATNAYVQHGKALSHRWKGEQERRTRVKAIRQAEKNQPSWWVGLGGRHLSRRPRADRRRGCSRRLRRGMCRIRRNLGEPEPRRKEV